MIDYIKLDISYLNTDKILKNEKLTFNHTLNEIDGAIYKSVARYSNLKFLVTPKHKYVCGSFHKYYNFNHHLGDQNHTQFTFDQFLWVVNDLKEKFGFVPERSKILNLEYGVNIKINENPSELLQTKVLFYKYKYPNTTDYYSKGYKIEYNFDDYKIKMYDKGCQYQIGENIMRYEISTKKSREIGKYSITYLNDLMEINNQIKLHEDLVRRFSDIMIIDSLTPHSEMTSDEKQLYMQSQSNSFFHELRKGASGNNRVTLARNTLKTIVKKFRLDRTHRSLIQLIESKKNELFPLAC